LNQVLSDGTNTYNYGCNRMVKLSCSSTVDFWKKFEIVRQIAGTGAGDHRLRAARLI
jgi:hypothetical protein